MTPEMCDKFRLTVPSVLFFYPRDIMRFSPMLQYVPSVIHSVMDFKFPEGVTSHDKGTFGGNTPEGKTIEGHWKIQKRREQVHVHCEEGYACMIVSTDLFEARSGAGIPCNLEELKDVYASHELCVYIPKDPYTLERKPKKKSPAR